MFNLKNAIFWEVTSRAPCKKWHFGRIYRLYHQGDKNRQDRYNANSN
jgi:hypothetical protein